MTSLHRCSTCCLASLPCAATLLAPPVTAPTCFAFATVCTMCLQELVQASIQLANHPEVGAAEPAAARRGGKRGARPPHMGRDEREALADALLSMGGGGDEQSTFFGQVASASSLTLQQFAC